MIRKSQLLVVSAIGLFSVLGGTSCNRHEERHEEFVSHAECLLDSTFRYYRAGNTCLFNETYPKNDEKVTYLAGTDTVQGDRVAYLWPTSGLLSAVSALWRATKQPAWETMLDTLIMPGLRAYRDTLRTPWAYQSYPTSAGEADRYYDDNIWIAIDCTDCYAMSGKQHWLKEAEEIWDFLMSGRDGVMGDGIYWCEQKKTSKNTCSNAPAAVLALKLYGATRNGVYLKAGKDLYHWTKNNLQDPDDGLYWDNRKPDGSIGRTKYAYNSGQMLQAAALLYKATGEPQYAADVKRLEEACGSYFFDEADEEYGFRTLKNGNVWFVAVMLRGLMEAYGVTGNRQCLDDFVCNLDYMWKKNRDRNGLFADNCLVEQTEKRQEGKWLLTQAALVEMYARLSLLSTDE